jgi:hypothetical protein
MRNAGVLSVGRRALLAGSMVLGALVFLGPPASAKDATYTANVAVKRWNVDTRRAAAQKAADKGCRDGHHPGARIKVRKGARVATYEFDCVAGSALAR